MKEFEDIAHSGGKVTFHNGQQRYEMSNPYPVVVYEILCAFNGVILGRGSFGTARTLTPLPALTMMMMSDKEGYFGFNCPKCNKYFRANLPHEYIFCPYCLNYSNSIDFLTANQKQYLELYYNKLVECMSSDKEIIFELDGLIANLENNIIRLDLYEERQQKLLECEPCKTKFDVLGIYASCPSCGLRNYADYFSENISRIKNSDSSPELRLKESVELYSGLGSDIKNLILINLPFSKLAKNKVESLDFQNIKEANNIMSSIFGIKLYNDNVEVLIQLYFQRRHIIVHNHSIVDNKYILKTNDQSFRLGQKITLDAIDTNKFISELKIQTIKMLSDLNTLWIDYISKLK